MHFPSNHNAATMTCDPLVPPVSGAHVVCSLALVLVVVVMGSQAIQANKQSGVYECPKTRWETNDCLPQNSIPF